jgi:hypothetical protein
MGYERKASLFFRNNLCTPLTPKGGMCHANLFYLDGSLNVIAVDYIKCEAPFRGDSTHLHVTVIFSYLRYSLFIL